MQLHTLQGYIQSIYLVEYPHGLLLLDGCCRADVGTVLRYIRDQLQRPITDLKLVVVTHMHPDHAGGAYDLRRISGCQIATGVADKPWYQGASGWLMHLTDVALGMWMAHRLGQPLKNLWYRRSLQPDRLLSDGEALPGFEQWQVVATHGHTNGDISLWHRPSHRLYVADLIVKVRDNFVTPWPLFHPNRYRQSVNKVRDMQPDYLLLAHGGEIKTHPSHPCYQVHTPAIPRTHWRAAKERLQAMLNRSVRP
ncbi:MBL fold metallo-hydrolase [uncultured Ferrimonas sp.]|uniref:MBL fold metallo-hydrolase n=1 Tax=uncultured Ferrimonas sp. TaxID=432640 RepID=UPI002619E89F|nr:MBL fold metallo-hydrolase [uncultured Ferrimonas sp.]